MTLNSCGHFCEVWALVPKEERGQLKVFSQIHFLEEKQIEITWGKKVVTGTFTNGISSDRKKVNLCTFHFRRSFQ